MGKTFKDDPWKGDETQKRRDDWLNSAQAGRETSAAWRRQNGDRAAERARINRPWRDDEHAPTVAGMIIAAEAKRDLKERP